MIYFNNIPYTRKTVVATKTGWYFQLFIMRTVYVVFTYWKLFAIHWVNLMIEWLKKYGLYGMITVCEGLRQHIHDWVERKNTVPHRCNEWFSRLPNSTFNCYAIHELKHVSWSVQIAFCNAKLTSNRYNTWEYLWVLLTWIRVKYEYRFWDIGGGGGNWNIKYSS